MSRPILLALETSSATASAAVSLPSGGLLHRAVQGARRGSADLFPMIQALLAEAGIELRQVQAVAFSRGPGSFTGLRLGAAIARTLPCVTRCRVIAVESLAALAQTAAPVAAVGQRVLALVDARQGRLYGAAYERAGDAAWTAREPLAVRPVADWLACGRSCDWVTGEGVAAALRTWPAESVRVAPAPLWTPQAQAVLALAERDYGAGRFCAPDDVAPLYVRPPECEEVYERRRAEAIRRREEKE